MTAREAQPAGPIERVTVYLTATSSTALLRAAETTSDTKTDTINRAIQTYALMVGEVADGSQVLVRQHSESTRPAQDFFLPDHTYTNSFLWEFRCVAVSVHPADGEQRAIGWLSRGRNWAPDCLNATDWERGGWVDRGETRDH